MIAIVIAYVILQIAATIFLYLQLATFTAHLCLAGIAVASYLAAHFRNPGYANPQMLKLATTTSSVEVDASVQPTSAKIENEQVAGRSFCRNCKEDQLLRMKHCYDCRKCVATFDHHCLWLDNCIGEKNRPIFYICLCANLTEISHAFFALILQMISNGEWFTSQIVFLAFVGMVGGGVGLLTVLHSYLMAANLTTWESLRWKRIHYLIDLQQNAGSPFSRGFIGNISDYWQSGFERKYKQWKFNEATLEQLRLQGSINKTQTKQQQMEKKSQLEGEQVV